MRVLMLNNGYLQHCGEEVDFEIEVDLPQANGCDVYVFVVNAWSART